MEENISGTWMEHFSASCGGYARESRVISEVETGGDTDESDRMGQESDDSIPCEDSVALSKEAVLDEIGRTKNKVVSRAWFLV